MNFTNSTELLELCSRENKDIWEIMLLREIKLSERTHSDIFDEMSEQYEIMKGSALSSLQSSPATMGGLIGGNSQKIYNHTQSAKTANSGINSRAMVYAMSVLETNASMGLIVAAPTAGASGVIPGSFLAIQQEYSFTDEEMTEALFTAGAVGVIIMINASVSGAECGCQAEVGSASAMAAAALTGLLGGTPQQCLDAASYALINLLGLVCDPIAGLVEMPCQSRNAVGANNALISADIVLSGVSSFIPFDETVKAMYRVGTGLPFELRESGLGGTAGTDTAQSFSCKFLQNCNK